MATLQTLVGGSWVTYSTARTPAVGNVRYFRWQGETATTGPAYTDVLPLAGAKIARAYLHDVDGTTPAITAGTLAFVTKTDNLTATVNGLSYAETPNDVTSSILTQTFGTMHTSTAASNDAAVILNPGPNTALKISGVTKGNADNTYDIIIEAVF